MQHSAENDFDISFAKISPLKQGGGGGRQLVRSKGYDVNRYKSLLHRAALCNKDLIQFLD